MRDFDCKRSPFKRLGVTCGETLKSNLEKLDNHSVFGFDFKVSPVAFCPNFAFYKVIKFGRFPCDETL